MVKSLGQGTYGSVYLIRKQDAEFAVKHLQANDGIGADALLDIDALVRLRNDPDIIHLIGVCYAKSMVAIILEAMDMNLSSYIRTTPVQIRVEIFPRLFRSLARVASLFETVSIGHFDIKPQNILVRGTGRLARFKVTDFGLSRALHLKRRPPLHEVFSLWYRPPEFLVRRHRTEFNVGAGDIWAIGLTLLEFITGTPLFPGRTNTIVLQRIHSRVTPKISYIEFLQRIQTGTITGQVELHLPQIESGLQDLLSRMLSFNPSDRPTGTEILSYFNLRLSPQHLLSLLDEEQPRRVEPELIRILFQTATRFQLSRDTQVIGLELLTRYLSKVSTESGPLIAYAAIRIAANYNGGIAIPTAQLGGPSFIEAEREFLQVVDYQVYNSNLVAVIERVYQRDLLPSTYSPEEFANRLDQLFTT